MAPEWTEALSLEAGKRLGRTSSEMGMGGRAAGEEGLLQTGSLGQGCSA